MVRLPRSRARALCLWLVSACLLAAAPARAAAPLELHGPSLSFEVWPRLEVYADPGGRLSAAQIAALPDSAWAPVPRRHHHYGTGDVALWARLQVRNASHPARDWILVHAQSFVDSVELYRLQADGWTRERGLRHASLDWFGASRNPAFPLTLPAGQDAQLLLRAQTLSLLRFPLHVMEQGEFLRSERASYLASGILMIIPIVVSFFMLLMWMISREKSLLVFTGLVLCALVGEIWIGGLMHAMMPWLDSRTPGLIGFGSLLVAISLAFTHARLFLGLDTKSPRIATVFRVMALVIPLMLLPELLGIGQGRNLVILVWLGAAVLFCGVSLMQMRRGLPYAGIYALAWGTYLGSAVLIVLNLAGLIAPNISNLTLFAQGSIVSLIFSLAAVGQVRDREQRAQLALAEEHRQLEATRARTELYAAANHDLRQPVQSLGLFIELLRNRRPDTDVGGLVERMRAAYISLSDFLDALLSASRLEAGATRPRWTVFPLQALLEPLAKEYGEQARAKHLRLHYVNSSVSVLSDRALLERVLRNLLSNAVRYTERGAILLGVRRRGASVEVQVLDTGSGISASAQGRAFERYTQFSDGSEGVGLGLSIVRGLCDLLGHEVSLRSAPGRGTLFGVRLPHARSTPADGRSALHGLRVLLVGIEPPLRPLCVQALAEAGAEVCLAGDTNEALAAVADGRWIPDTLVVNGHFGAGDNATRCLQALQAVGALPAGSTVVHCGSAGVGSLALAPGLRLLPLKSLAPDRLVMLLNTSGGKRQVA